MNELRGANQYSEITLYSLCSTVITVVITNIFYNLANQMSKPIRPIGPGFGLFHLAQPLNPGGPAHLTAPGNINGISHLAVDRGS